MAFEFTIRTHDFMGKGIVAGNWTATGVTGGTVTTGFNEVYHMNFSNAVADTNVLEHADGNVTLTCTNGDSGTFMIYGS